MNAISTVKHTQVEGVGPLQQGLRLLSLHFSARFFSVEGVGPLQQGLRLAPIFEYLNSMDLSKE